MNGLSYNQLEVNDWTSALEYDWNNNTNNNNNNNNNIIIRLLRMSQKVQLIWIGHPNVRRSDISL